MEVAITIRSLSLTAFVSALMAKEEGTIYLLYESDLSKFLALGEFEGQTCRIHKVNWKNSMMSRDWLERISTWNSSVDFIASVNMIPDKQDIKAVRKINQGEQECHSIRGDELPMPIPTQYQNDVGDSEVWGLEMDETTLRAEPLQQVLEGLCRSRKPDSAYISLVSQIHVPESFSKISEKDSADENVAVLRHIRRETECDKVEEKSKFPPVFFPSQQQLEAKRKLSFEYIKEISRLESVFCQ